MLCAKTLPTSAMSNLADEIKGTVTAVMNSSYQSYMNIYHRKYTYVYRKTITSNF